MLMKEEVHDRSKKIMNALPEHESIDDVTDSLLELNKQAALAVDLAAEVERLKTRWIPVSENNLPENAKVVLLRFANCQFPVVGYYSQNYECYRSISGGQYPINLATHYCELPEPPKEGEK